MRNYVIINGVNSLTIKGLAINELPPIVKAPMRVLQEEIDGRDGDIITDLGYGAYDKVMTIGLYDGYDINEIIAFFNNEGTIVFSDEADKYYNFKIIEQIDYERLIKFRTASITFHCQPFKYPLTETPVEITNEYVEAEGTSITLTPTAEAPISIDLKGNTYQYSTTGKNLCSPTWTSVEGNITFTKVYDENGNVAYIDVNGTANSVSYINVGIKTYSAGTYIMTGCPSGGSDSSYQQRFVSGEMALGTDNGSGATITLNSDTECFLRIRIASGYTANHLKFYPMVRLSSTSEGYEPYTNGASPNPDYPQEIHNVSGDNTIEICGKNILDKSSFLSGKKYNSSGQLENGGANDYYTTKKIYVQPSTTYKGQGTDYWRVCQFDSNDNLVDYHDYSNSTTKPTITTLANTKYLLVSLSGYGGFDSKNIQIEKGDTDTSYTPYVSQTQLISLGVGNNKFNGIVEQGAINADTGSTYESCKTSNATRIRTTKLIRLETSKTYTISCKTGYNVVIQAFDNDKKLYIITGTTNNWTSSVSFTNIPYIAVAIRKNDNSNITPSEVDNAEVMLNIGSSAIPYEPYYSIELNKIGNYQDYFYYTDKWYKYGVIKKQKMSVLSTSNLEGNGIRVLPKVTTPAEAYPVLYCTHFRRASSYNEATSAYNAYPNFLGLNESGQPLCNVQGYTTKQEYIDLFTNNDIYLYYPLATPVITEITDSTLISQLEAIKNMTSYNGTTNISQENNDEPFIISAKAMKQGSGTATITNSGNIYSKPTIDIEGTGIVDVYIGSNQIFSVNVDEEVIIDSTNLEAYKPDGTLANRNVTGNIANLKLPTGNSTIKVDGDIDKATITNYTRWL